MRQDVEFRQWPPSVVTWLKCLLNAASASLKRDTAHEATAKIRQFERPRLQIAPVGKDRKPASLALRHDLLPLSLTHYPRAPPAKAARSKGGRSQQPSNPKTETRKPKSKARLSGGALPHLGRLLIRPSDFGLLSGFGLRISGLTHAQPALA